MELDEVRDTAERPVGASVEDAGEAALDEGIEHAALLDGDEGAAGVVGVGASRLTVRSA